MNVKKMTDEQLRLKVAELAGWERGPAENIGICGLGVIASKGMCWHHKDEEDNWQDNPPDFTDDLNAMHEAEMILTEKQKTVYLTYLGEKVVRDGADYGWCWGFATARQRAEAFVMALEKF